jgi:hypothetical protein
MKPTSERPAQRCKTCGKTEYDHYCYYFGGSPTTTYFPVQERPESVEPELPEREAQWADCPRCRQKVLAPHECYESVLSRGEREAFEKWNQALADYRKDIDNAFTATALLLEEPRLHCMAPHFSHREAWDSMKASFRAAESKYQAAYRAGAASRKGALPMFNAFHGIPAEAEMSSQGRSILSEMDTAEANHTPSKTDQAVLKAARAHPLSFE